MYIQIEWLYDDHKCETCGVSWADGAKVTNQDTGEVILDLEPLAHCFRSQSYDKDEVFIKLLNHLGHIVTTVDPIYNFEDDDDDG